MNNEQRYYYFESGKLQRAVEIELLDWAGYWATVGVESITDPLQRAQTKQMILLILRSLPEYIKQAARLAISYDEIKNAVEPTEANIHSVVTNIMTFKLGWLTGITSIPEPEPEE